jgi:hypothetical protein
MQSIPQPYPLSLPPQQSRRHFFSSQEHHSVQEKKPGRTTAPDRTRNFCSITASQRPKTVSMRISFGCSSHLPHETRQRPKRESICSIVRNSLSISTLADRQTPYRFSVSLRRVSLFFDPISSMRLELAVFLRQLHLSLPSLLSMNF